MPDGMTPKSMIVLMLVLLAFLCFVVDAFGFLRTHHPELTALGLALWALAYIVKQL